MRIVVQVQSSNGEASSSGKALTFAKDEVTLGRSPKNDIVLPDPKVSGRHATFSLKKSNGSGKIYVKDVGSSNGTFLEDQKIDANVEFPLQPNQRLVVGSYVLLLSVEADEAGKKSEKKAAKPKKAAAPKKASKASSYEEEVKIKRDIHDALIERLDLRRKDIISLSEDEVRKRARTVVENIIVDMRWSIPAGLEKEALIKQILDEALGLGPLEELLADDDCSEIMVNSYDMIYAERNGKLTLSDLRYSSEKAVLGAIERIIAPIGRRIDESSPLVDARLKDGSRVNAVIRPLALRGPCITIRKFKKEPLGISDLVKFGSLSQGMAEFMELAVSNRLNTVISGGTGSGKTTLLNVISSFIPDGERVITVEDAAELSLPQEHVVSFETRPPNLEGKGAINIRDLVKNALRMRPDRIIVGECRGGEALDMLQAMNTGHDGSMTTGHANAPVDMIRRLETMVLTSGLDLPIRAIREQIASAVNMVIQQTRFSCGTRKITAISEVVGMDNDEGQVILEDIFIFKQQGYDEEGRVDGFHQATGYVPKFFRKLQERGLPVNADVFSPN